MASLFETSPFLNIVNPEIIRIEPLPLEHYKVREPWQIIWESRDPEDGNSFDFVSLTEGRYANRATALTATQMELPFAIGATVEKARDINQGQNFNRDRIYLVNAIRDKLAQVVLPKEEILPMYHLGNISAGPIFDQ
jgi:hypothetical protein